MYSFPYYTEKDQATVLAFVRAHPFAFIAGCDEKGQPIATQIPVFIDEREGKLFLSGHIMKGTDHHKAFLANPNTLVVFTGAHTYVSASWYSDTSQASTWNYMSVHARGPLHFQDHEALLHILQRTTDHFENNPQSGSNYKDLPTEYVEKLTKAIVAFEIEVQEIKNVFKLSQNKDEKSYYNIIEKLEGQDADGKVIAGEMKQRIDTVFPKQ